MTSANTDIAARAAAPFRAVYRHAEGALLVLCTLLLVADVLLGILARFIRMEIVFATELGKYLFIWLCAVGVSAAAKDNQHVRITLLADRLPLPDRLVRAFGQLLFLALSLFLCYWGFRLTWNHLTMGKSVMGFDFPIFIFTAALPVGFGLTAVRIAHNLLTLFNSKPPSSGPEPDSSPHTSSHESVDV